LQTILGNSQILSLDSSVNGGAVGFKESFDLKEFKVNLNPLIIYEKKE
jgi:hypothetical protein